MGVPNAHRSRTGEAAYLHRSAVKPQDRNAWGRTFLLRSSRHPGHMYEVNIRADPSHFLDWDKPLSDDQKQKL
jgi:hypothetical protein